MPQHTHEENRLNLAFRIAEFIREKLADGSEKAALQMTNDFADEDIENLKRTMRLRRPISADTWAVVRYTLAVEDHAISRFAKIRRRR